MNKQLYNYIEDEIDKNRGTGNFKNIFFSLCEIPTIHILWEN